MKEGELRQHAKCNLCGRLIGESRLPLFWTVTIQRYGLKLDAIQRQDGLTAMLGGNALLAMHMGTNEDLAAPVMEPVTLTVCETCAIEAKVPVAVMALTEEGEGNVQD